MNIELNFSEISLAVLKLIILMAAGYLFYLFKIIDDDFLDKLSLFLVKVIFPCLITSKTVTHFSYAEYPFWWALPLVAVLFIFSGAAISYLILILSGRAKIDSVKEFICAGGFQNAGYLPMNIILFSFAGLIRERLLIYLFLYIVGFNLLMWSFVPVIISRKNLGRICFKNMINPPVIATIFSLLWVMFFGKGSMPDVVRAPLTQVGNAAFPMALITLGAYLNRYKAFIPGDKICLIAGVIHKLLIFPLVIFIFLFFIPLEESLSFFIFLQAIMPVAVSLVVIGSYEGADNKLLSSLIFYTHFIAILLIPLWLWGYEKMIISS